VGSHEGGVSYERGTPVQPTASDDTDARGERGAGAVLGAAARRLQEGLHHQGTSLSSDDVFQETSARYRAVAPSSGSNVIPRRARPGLAGLRPHTILNLTCTACGTNGAMSGAPARGL